VASQTPYIRRLHLVRCWFTVTTSSSSPAPIVRQHNADTLVLVRDPLSLSTRLHTMFTMASSTIKTAVSAQHGCALIHGRWMMPLAL
jgi:hypothetical protein